jgi:transposase
MKKSREALVHDVGDEIVAESIAVVAPVVNSLTRQIAAVERSVLEKAKLRAEFEPLHSVPGLGNILAFTIMCETGDIARFPKVGNFASYCRCVKSERRSNDKNKGKGNRKNGNKYLSWAFSELANHIVRFEPLAKRWIDRKKRRCHPMVAARALANKMARACYYVMRDQVCFDSNRAFKQ